VDTIILIGLLCLLSIPVSVVGALFAARGPELMAGLFDSKSELGWPRGVQEEDGPVGWGARVPLPQRDLDAAIDDDVHDMTVTTRLRPVVHRARVGDHH
jgi:hypothetical protein